MRSKSEYSQGSVRPVVQRVPCLDPLDVVMEIARVAVGSAPRESGLKYPKVICVGSCFVPHGYCC